MLVRLALVVVDDGLRARLRGLVAGPDTVVAELSVERHREQLLRGDCDVVLLDAAALPPDRSGAVRALRAVEGRPEVLVVGHLEAEERAALLAAGCLAVVSDRLTDTALTETLRALIDRRREASELQMEANAAAGDDPGAFGEFLSSSPGMSRFLHVAKKVSRSDSTVLLLGETGVGKERLARTLHAQGPRAGGPFVVINCGAMAETLLEAELFGHERGAFTGAERARRGHFELAHRGTIFLDEVGELPLHLQVKLLRVLQERTVQRLGSEKPLNVDVRILAATNRDLQSEMQEKRFRSDLYYRLSVVTLEIPPLRDRPEDIPALVDSYFQQFRTVIPTAARSISPAAMQALQAYPWPGNVRELINVVERAVLLCDGEEIRPEDFPDSVAFAAAPATASPIAAAVQERVESFGELDPEWLGRTLSESRHAWNAAFERAYLTGLLRETRGRIGDTAARAGIDPRSLYAKMKHHGLRKEDYR